MPLRGYNRYKMPNLEQRLEDAQALASLGGSIALHANIEVETDSEAYETLQVELEEFYATEGAALVLGPLVCFGSDNQFAPRALAVWELPREQA